MQNNLTWDGLQEWLRPFLLSPRHIFVAVSGGADSMALITLLNAVFEKEDVPKRSCHVLHVNHMLRGEASDGDANFVRHWANAHGWLLHSTSLPIRVMAEKSGRSIETEARLARYAFFQEIITKTWQSERRSEPIPTKKAASTPDESEQVKNIAKPLLFLAHHRDDQVESILLHLFRGAGALGIRGMQRVEERKHYVLLRPFLSVTKREIYDFNRRYSIPWREDETNGDMDVERNALRNRILPSIREHLNPSVDEAILRFSSIYSEEDRVLGETSKAWVEKYRVMGNEGGVFSPDLLHRNAQFLDATSLPRKPFLRLPLALQRRVIREWVKESVNSVDEDSLFGFQETEQIRESFALPVGKRLALYGMIILTDVEGVHLLTKGRYDALRRREVEAGSLSTSLIQTKAQQIPIEGFGIFHVRMCPSESNRDSTFTTTPDCAYMDIAACSTLSWRRGDNQDLFTKFGGGTKTLRRMWNEWHLPEVLRTNWPVFTDGDAILWVPGLGRSAIRPAAAGGKTICITWRQQ